MNTSKKYLDNLAKSLYKKSLTEGNLDEKKVKLILKELTSARIAKLSTILKTYKRLVSEKLGKEEIIIETNSPVTLSPSFVNELKKKTGAKSVKNIVNHDIVFGAKITHGDWVLEDTLESKLKQIVNNNSTV